MRFFSSLLSILTPAVVGVMGAAVRDIPVLSEYDQLFDLCEAGGPNSYVGVRYQVGPDITFKFGECYPYELDGNNLAQMAVFCKSVTCNNNPNLDCTGGAVPPASVDIPAGFSLINIDNWVALIGKGATCQSNGLP